MEIFSQFRRAAGSIVETENLQPIRVQTIDLASRVTDHDAVCILHNAIKVLDLIGLPF